jgi:type II secretion system protein N
MNLPIPRGSGPIRVPTPWRRIDLPVLARGRALVERVAPTTAVPLALYGVYTLLLFLVFCAATFPHELVLRQLLAGATTGPVTVDVRGVRLGWTLAYAIDDLRVLRRGADPALPLLSASHVRAAPSLLGLLRGRPFPLSVRADVYGGTIDATADVRPDAFAVDAELARVDVSRYAGLQLFMDGTLQGRIDGKIALAGAPSKPATTAGRIDLRVADLALEGGKVQGVTVPDLHFPELHAAAAIKAGRLDIGELVGRGREVNVQGSGNALLSHPLAATLLNLEILMSPAPDLPDNLRMLLNLVPGTPTATGERRIQLTGTVAQPRVQ